MHKKSVTTFILAVATLALTCPVPLHAISNFDTGDPVFGNIEMPFIVNQGQFDGRIVAFTQTAGGKVYVKKNGDIVYSFSDNEQRSFIFEEHADRAECNMITFEDKAPANINYFKGNDRSNWRRNIPAYNVINLGELYDRITLRLKAYRNNIEKLFYIAPGGNPNDILIRLEGIKNVTVDESGKLEILTEFGIISFTRPIAYQEVDGKRHCVRVAYRVNNNTYGFTVGEYNRNHTLIIDPLLASTFLGGTDMEGGDGIPDIDLTHDIDDNVYVIGKTRSIDFPIASGAVQSDIAGEYDIFVAKFDSCLTTLLAATFLGGDANEQCPKICLDANGNIFIAGATNSTDYPVTQNAYDADLSGDWDIFISALNENMDSILASTYLGGNGAENFGFDLTMGHDGDVLIAGFTTDSSFPTTTGAYDESYNGGSSDIFVSKLDSLLSSMLASTLIGGSYQDEGMVSIALDADGNVYLLGSTGSSDYPTTSSAYDTSFNGPYSHGQYDLDLCISKLDNNLTALLSSTFLGGNDFERAYLLSTDDFGNVFVTGHTSSLDFPVTPGAFDNVHDGFSETFVAKLNGELTELLGSTYFTPNGVGGGFFTGMEPDAQGNLWLAGNSEAADFPVTDDAYDTTFNGGPLDAILVKLRGDCDTILYATFLGGNGRELDAAITVLNPYEVFIAGYTEGNGFPFTSDAYDTSYNGGQDAYVCKFTINQFTRVTEGPHVNDVDFTSGVCWIDYNNDNYLDIFLVTHWPDIVGPPLPYHYLYHNNGDGTFTSVNKLEVIGTGIEGYGASCADYDNDGDIDVLVANFKMDPCFLYVNDGSGNFTVDTGNSISAENAASSSPVWIDYDLNGILDLFIGNASDDNLDGYDPYPNYLYKDVAGIFTKIISGEIVTDSKHTYSATWSDYDNDGDPDLFTSSHLMEGNDLYRNDGNGYFTSMTGSVLSSDAGYCFSSSWADYDNDGDMDLYVGNIGGEPFLYSNNGDATFTKISGHGLHTDGGSANQGVWGDYDNDGDLDIFVTQYNTDYPDLSQGSLFENQGGNTFIKITDGIIASDTHVVIAAAWGDYDRDGDLDLYTGRFDPLFTGNPIYSKNRLYRNNGNSNNWITIKPAGTNSNRSAIGSKIRLKANIGGSSIWQMREIASQTGSSAQQPLEAHFGLGDATTIDSIKIEWPSGMVDVYTDVAPNQFIIYTETVCGDADGNFNVNLLDITYLISYLYKDGPDPHNMQAADPDGNGTTNLLDITYLIAYLYKGGTKPVC